MTQYQDTVSYQNSDGTPLNVAVALDFNVQTGLLTARYRSINPSTGLAPTGSLDGFLPPNDSTHVGEGYVQYTIHPKASLATGPLSTRRPRSSSTPTPRSTLRPRPTPSTPAGPPVASHRLPQRQTSTSFTVSWSGEDDAGGSGIAAYDVYVSDNSGVFTLWQSDTSQISATFTGQIGHTYGFYSIATDNVGNVQAIPAAAQATVTIVDVRNQVLFDAPTGT